LSDRRGFNGFDASVAGNLTRYFGLKGNVSGHFKSDSFTDGLDTINTRERMWQAQAIGLAILATVWVAVMIGGGVTKS
jgi:hypothetical protein